MIESVKNDHIKNIIKLRDNPKERKKQGLYIVEGPKMVLEAIRHGMATSVYASESLMTDNEFINAVSGVEINIVADNVFKAMSDTVNPQGVIALVRWNTYDISELLDMDFGICEYNGNEIKRILILEDVQDPGNLGTIFRTAEAAGFNGIVMTKGTVSAYNPKVVRSTMGAMLRLPFAYGESIEDIIDTFHERGIKVYGMALNGSDVRNASFAEKAAFIIGNESKGIKESTLDICDSLLKIPMYGQTESLNAAVAAGLIMYSSTMNMI